MKIRREQILLGVSLLLGVLAAGTLYFAQRAVTKTVPVIVAARDLPGRTVIQRDDLKVALVPPAAVDAKAARTGNDLIGKLLLSPVYEGEQIRMERLNLSELELAADEVAMAIDVTLSGSVGGMVKQGDVVDVYLATRAERTGRVEVYKTGEALRVLSVRDNNARGKEGGSDAAGVPAVVVLKVPASSAKYLREAASLGELTLVKQSPAADLPERGRVNQVSVTQTPPVVNMPVSPSATSAAPSRAEGAEETTNPGQDQADPTVDGGGVAP